jgi:hypothetical protein
MAAEAARALGIRCTRSASARATPRRPG